MTRYELKQARNRLIDIVGLENKDLIALCVYIDDLLLQMQELEKENANLYDKLEAMHINLAKNQREHP